MKRISLCGTWQLRGRDQKGIDEAEIALDAKVPGLAQMTLSENGIVPRDLYMGENIRSLEKYESYEWWYDRDFEVDEVKPRTYLVFRGVDCVAEYFVNGERIGESDNMFIPHEFDVSDKLRVGTNHITVHLTSPMAAVHDDEYDLYNLFSRWNAPVNTHIRRAPHSYGWDSGSHQTGQRFLAGACRTGKQVKMGHPVSGKCTGQILLQPVISQQCVKSHNSPPYPK